MRRIAAHEIEYDGRVYEMSVATVSDGGEVISIQPLTHETANTEWHVGRVVINKKE